MITDNCIHQELSCFKKSCYVICYPFTQSINYTRIILSGDFLTSYQTEFEIETFLRIYKQLSLNMQDVIPLYILYEFYGC